MGFRIGVWGQEWGANITEWGANPENKVYWEKGKIRGFEDGGMCYLLHVFRFITLPKNPFSVFKKQKLVRLKKENFSVTPFSSALKTALYLSK